jgi:hypothetical protein
VALFQRANRPFEVAAMQLASHDFHGVLVTLANLRGNEADLLRGAAQDGLDQPVEAEHTFREILRRDPDRPEAHFDLALLTLSHLYDPDWPTPARLRAAHDHARVFLCLLDTAAHPELADDGTDLLRRLEERRTGHSAWFWKSDEPQPPLPLPRAKLGREAQGFSPRHPVATTCSAVLRRANPK